MQLDVKRILREFNKLPRFKDGRIDYTASSKAPVLLCFVKFQEKFLLLKRSKKVGTYHGKWNVVAGYIDEPKPLQEKVLEELREELGIRKEEIQAITFKNAYDVVDKEIHKTWVVHPVLVELQHEPTITLDWEHTQFVWIHPEDVEKYDTVIGMKEGLQKVLKD